ncbi:organoarsenical effux MFS transporter ArsJ [Sneathiella marina]|uniref:Organoarsenical effux MFS transporter ArsJ n=1 Tax=Sneathiella marina TaxID=2950108 RepID=A0ABY4W0U4_9PROT|nr:organoarsenical effux MFS transporter ArsJ [Sneathiella marina]USG60750.1 organoarsenical effux MFS transporter ArsJ [Sneathiella marina]
MTQIRDYAIVTGAYWGLTLTDGALRMLVLLHFHALGYSPLEIAFLFVFYEVSGVLTNLIGGWIAARFGLRITLHAGLAMQIVALFMLSFVDASWSREFSVFYVFVCQGLSGIAKDLAKMSSKSAVKLLVSDNSTSTLFKLVALLTGSKNTLKGIGFFLGGFLLMAMGFQFALIAMAVSLLFILGVTMALLRMPLGDITIKPAFRKILSKSKNINLISGARFFLFGGRDVWFVVAVPLYFRDILDWSYAEIGSFMAIWVIAYGFVQVIAPRIIKKSQDGLSDEVAAASHWAYGLAATPLLIAALVYYFVPVDSSVESVDLATFLLVSGLLVFGALFAVNSSLHSYLILALTEEENITLDVGFYYMANAAGRLAGTLFSGLFYQIGGLSLCLTGSAAMIVVAGLIVRRIDLKPPVLV